MIYFWIGDCHYAPYVLEKVEVLVFPTTGSHSLQALSETVRGQKSISSQELYVKIED